DAGTRVARRWSLAVVGAVALCAVAVAVAKQGAIYAARGIRRRGAVSRRPVGIAGVVGALVAVVEHVLLVDQLLRDASDADDHLAIPRHVGVGVGRGAVEVLVLAEALFGVANVDRADLAVVAAGVVGHGAGDLALARRVARPLPRAHLARATLRPLRLAELAALAGGVEAGSGRHIAVVGLLDLDAALADGPLAVERLLNQGGGPLVERRGFADPALEAPRGRAGIVVLALLVRGAGVGHGAGARERAAPDRHHRGAQNPGQHEPNETRPLAARAIVVFGPELGRPHHRTEHCFTLA